MFQLRAQEPRWLQGGSLELADAGSDRVDDAGLWPPLERILDNRMPEGHAALATCLRRPKPLAGLGWVAAENMTRKNRRSSQHP